MQGLGCVIHGCGGMGNVGVMWGCYGPCRGGVGHTGEGSVFHAWIGWVI